MPLSLRIPILLLIVVSLLFGLLVWGTETGIGHVPYDQTDSQGHPMGFNDRLYPEHITIILRAIQLRDYLPTARGLASAYFWLYLGAHGLALHRIATTDHRRYRANLLFFAVQVLLFPIGIPGMFVLVGYTMEWSRGRFDRECIVDIPFFCSIAHSTWLVASMTCLIALFLAQRVLAWRTLRQTISR